MNKVSNTITEEGIWLKFGFLPVYAKPLTLSQLIEIGEYVQKLTAVTDLDTRSNTVATALEVVDNVKPLHEIVIIALFRNKMLRKILRKYILKRLTFEKYARIINHIAKTFDANFFLASINFLRETKQLMMVPEETPHGH